ncbi:metal-sulfur cluster assembly factor [Hyalangium rubrum]|uniref:Iron-sulfur cluster assembly protein n=1 Tax=Hyalangium rubrum TaxID=3103134 RepID=A0ABU5H7V4_9BACT|nr:iron-sulfur cluster assembly protein [Hyalangium sp. s54d21]MDY7229553.1 iron-sulfur cluster assembly protein [Hyalangium sp. s54d21]
MSTLREAIEQALDEVKDPCSVGIGKPAGLVTMGLVKELRLREAEAGGHHVELRMRLTSPCCMMGPRFAMEAEKRLQALEGILSVDVSFDPEIDWEPRHMREEYRRSLPKPAALAGVGPWVD